MLTYLTRTENYSKLKEAGQNKRDLWIHATNLNSADISKLVSEFNLDETMLKDSTDYFEVPRVEYEGDVTYFYTRYPTVDNGEDTTAPLLIAIADNFVLTTSHEEPEFLSRFRKATSNELTTNSTHFFIHLMSLVEHSFARALIAVRKEVHKTRVSINNINNADIERFVVLEGIVNDFTSSLIPTSQALEVVLSGKWLNLTEDDKELVEDLVIATKQTVEMAKSVGRTISTIRSAYSVIVSNRLNKIVETLTSITIILTVPTVIASLFGMNVPVPLQNNNAGFLYVLALVAALCIAVTYLLRRNRLF
jgi:magnesium transporter